MAEKRHRATKEEALNAKLQKNAQAKAKYQEKINALIAEEAELKKALKELTDVQKKADRAAEAKAKREEKRKQEKEVIQAIKKSGLSMEEVLAKLND